METSEDDAGASTNASRRVSAREKDVVQIEDVNATNLIHQDSSEQRASCEIIAMSEDNFDGDSVPSPSTQDVNTSTEAILDMIDEIVDGPGAPKRLSLSPEESNDSKETDSCPVSEVLKSDFPLPTCSSNIPLALSKSSISISQNKIFDDIKVDCIQPQASFSELELSVLPEKKSDIEPVASCSKEGTAISDSPSSSELNTNKSVKVCGPGERTIQNVALCDKKDKVNIESAVSTSSDNSCEIRDSSASASKRSPLRRRLVRPVPSRPDSTVSSSVDTSVNSDVSQSEYVAKDVSSSSDVVSSVNESKPEEIRNISEVSTCRAETSVGSPKKIRLVRQKVTQICNIDTLDVKKQANLEQCRSPSSNSQCSYSQPAVTPSLDSSMLSEKADFIDISKDASPKPLITENEADVAITHENTQGLKEIINQHEIDNDSKVEDDSKTMPPIKLNLPTTIESSSNSSNARNVNDSSVILSDSVPIKQIPKLTIKIGSKQSDEMKSPIPKLTIKPIRAPEPVNEKLSAPILSVTKLNIKPIHKHAEKVNEIHRKSSSSEISESECSENDESTSTSDQASTSDQCSTDVVPKVTIKLGKPGTDTEGQFYTEKNIPKLTIKTIQSSENDAPLSPSKLKLFISQSEEIQSEKIPKLTIKTVACNVSENQPLSPRLAIKPIRPPDNIQSNATQDHQISSDVSKTRNLTDTNATNEESKDNIQVPKITIKPLTKPEVDLNSKSKKPQESIDIPVVTKLNIKPLVKPTDSIDIMENVDEKVPVVSKLNIKPIMKPKDSILEGNKEDIPKFTKLNIKPIKNPAINSCEETVCDDLKTDKEGSNIPIVTKINIKPIIKPLDEDIIRDMKNQTSETGNSSDENFDNIPIVTKINIKPICKPDNIIESTVHEDEKIPVVTKLNIKPLTRPDNIVAPCSPKKEALRSSTNIPTVTKLNIKPVLKPEESKEKSSDDLGEIQTKNPPLVMKINMKTVESYVSDNQSNVNKNDHGHCNNIGRESIPSKINIKPATNQEEAKQVESNTNCHSSNNLLELANESRTKSKDENPKTYQSHHETKQNCFPKSGAAQEQVNDMESPQIRKASATNIVDGMMKETRDSKVDSAQSNSLLNAMLKHTNPPSKVKNLPSKQNCTLLKKLLESKSQEDENHTTVSKFHTTEEDKVKSKFSNFKDQKRNLKNEGNCEQNHDILVNSDINDFASNSIIVSKVPFRRDLSDTCENLTKPLEVSISDKAVQHSSDQDSPRIVIKINKVDLGSSAKNLTEDVREKYNLGSPEEVNDRHQNKNLTNSKKKHIDTPMPVGKRLRSSRVTNSAEKGQLAKQILNKRPSTEKSPPTEESPPQAKEKESILLDTKRIKLGQLFAKASSLSPPAKNLDDKQDAKSVNHSLLNNENCAKNGSSKLHNILSNLHGKQLHNLPFNDLTHRGNNESPDLKSSTSMGSADGLVIERNSPAEKLRPEVHEMIFQDNSESRDFNLAPEEMSQDPLETCLKDTSVYLHDNLDVPKTVEITPQPKKRGRPRKIPLSEGAKPIQPIQLPVPALEERPQRSLRLSRERPALVVKPRGRGRGRGRRLISENNPKDPDYLDGTTYFEKKIVEDIDPTSSRIKLPRMTEALDKMPCSTPLTSRRRNSSSSDLYDDSQDFKADMDTSLPKMENPFLKSPDILGSVRGSRGRGSRGGRGRAGRTPRGRGRGRGGGRGAMYMKETMGIYGRVCGPATTTVQLFEEETCMMDDNATPSKPSHLLDEDSQSSVKSSTNESTRLKKSKFADLFDSNKVWTAADVKEYSWPLEDRGDEQQIMMIQEQVAMFLGVKSFKRRYPELKRRTITGDERNYVLGKGLVTEALCDLGITAVDASEVLDIMLSDYPHKYEEYRSHQRFRQLNEPEEEDVKPEITVEKIEMKMEQKSGETKPDLPKVDPEKLRLEMAAAAVASAGEWNARMNAARRGACADLQSLTVLRRRQAQAAPATHVRPPAGFYPHALLPGQYQHCYRRYTPEELRYFPLNTVLGAPPAPPSPIESSSESEEEWGSRYSTSDDSDTDTHRNAKRKKLSKTKRNSITDSGVAPREEEVVDTCRTCKLRLEANRKYTHERFLVCATCNCKLHPTCVDLQPDTIRKAREYAWQCGECKTCGVCTRAADTQEKLLFCDLCDRGFHLYCLGMSAPPNGRWLCVECAVCKSCGARSPGGLSSDGGGSGGGGDEPRWQHQTRRGPGGHKVYSHSLCAPCARAYRIGRYCPLCERSFIGPKGTMQLVICKLCDRQLHQECVRQTVSQLKVLDYTCGDCKRGGITSRAAAVRLAPRTIATLFMAKRRFNKYAHRQYLQSRLAQAAQDNEPDPQDPDDETSDAEAH